MMIDIEFERRCLHSEISQKSRLVAEENRRL